MSSVENNAEIVVNLNPPETSVDILTDTVNANLLVYSNWERVLHSDTWKNILGDNCHRRMLSTRSMYKPKEKMESASSPRPDFSDELTQWAYNYVFMPRHAHLVYNALSSPPSHINRLLSDDYQQMESVCAIGGGPATDVVGLTMAFSECSIANPFAKKAHVLDLNVKWKRSWIRLYNTMPTTLQILFPKVLYHHFDFKINQLTTEQKNIIREARIVTMIKSLSPVAAYLKDVRKELSEENNGSEPTINRWHSLYEILNTVAPGHFVLYIDNRTGPQRKLLMDTVEALNYEILIDRSMDGVKLPKEIVSSSLSKEIATKLHGYKPCGRAGRNEVILLQKKCD